MKTHVHVFMFTKIKQESRYFKKRLLNLKLDLLV